MKCLTVTAALCAAFAFGGGAAAQPPAPPSPVAAGPQRAGVEFSRKGLAPDADIFVEKCAMCHRRNGMGTNILARRLPPDQAMLEARKDLAGDYIRMAVRSGIGIMPRLGRGEVSDAQLDRIISHLTGKTPPGKGHK